MSGNRANCSADGRDDRALHEKHPENVAPLETRRAEQCHVAGLLEHDHDLNRENAKTTDNEDCADDEGRADVLHGEEADEARIDPLPTLDVDVEESLHPLGIE